MGYEQFSLKYSLLDFSQYLFISTQTSSKY